MKLNQIESFVVLAEELHFGRAAERLHRSQPPLSRQIRQLEEELGVELFTRSAQRVGLTEAGRVFLAEVAPVLARLRHAVEATRRAASGEAGHLAIGVTGSAMFGVVPPIVREFRRRYPGVSVELRLSPKGEQEKALKERRISIGFVRSISDDPELAQDLVLQEPLVMAVSRANPLATQPVVTLEDLRGQGFILYRGQSSPSIADQIVHYCQEAGFTPRIVQETEDMQSAAALAALDLGITLVAESLQQMQLRDLVYRPLTGPGPGPMTRLYAVFRRDDPSPILRAFRAACAESNSPEAPAGAPPPSR